MSSEFERGDGGERGEQGLEHATVMPGRDELCKSRLDFAACAVFRSAGEISTPKRSHQMMTLGYFARSTPAGMA